MKTLHFFLINTNKNHGFWLGQQAKVLITKTSENQCDNSMKKPKTKAAKQAKVKKVMGEYKSGTLHSGRDPKGPKKAPVVKNRRQAVAIALSEAGISKRK